MSSLYRSIVTIVIIYKIHNFNNSPPPRHNSYNDPQWDALAGTPSLQEMWREGDEEGFEEEEENDDMDEDKDDD